MLCYGGDRYSMRTACRSFVYATFHKFTYLFVFNDSTQVWRHYNVQLKGLVLPWSRCWLPGPRWLGLRRSRLTSCSAHPSPTTRSTTASGSVPYTHIVSVKYCGWKFIIVLGVIFIIFYNKLSLSLGNNIPVTQRFSETWKKRTSVMYTLFIS